jgi:hypothetical protein
MDIYEQLCLLGYNTMYSVESQARNQVKAGGKQSCVHAGFLLALFFDLEDEGDMFLRNVG